MLYATRGRVVRGGVCLQTMPDPNTDEGDLDPPELERLSLDTDEVAKRTGMVPSYVRNEERTPATETPFMRDTPFGEGPGIVGGETPFFTNSAPAYDFEMDDTDGIPTGLPNLYDLPEVPDVPVVSHTAETEVVEIEKVVETVRIERVTDTRAVERAEKRGHQNARTAFFLGVIASSILWGILAGLLYYRG